LSGLALVVVLASPACVTGETGETSPSPSPEQDQSIAESLQADGRFTLFIRLLVEGSVGLFDVMGSADFRTQTLFAPIDEGWGSNGDEKLEGLLDGDSSVRLRVIRLHILPRPLTSEQFETATFQTAHGSGVLEMDNSRDIATVNGAGIIETDLPVNNGTLHVIDDVLGLDD
jgi:uncharacterized surface protein with fasciclin (FAS1) repeats